MTVYLFLSLCRLHDHVCISIVGLGGGQKSPRGALSGSVILLRLSLAPGLC